MSDDESDAQALLINLPDHLHKGLRCEIWDIMGVAELEGVIAKVYHEQGKRQPIYYEIQIEDAVDQTSIGWVGALLPASRVTLIPDDTDSEESDNGIESNGAEDDANKRKEKRRKFHQNNKPSHARHIANATNEGKSIPFGSYDKGGDFLISNPLPPNRKYIGCRYRNIYHKHLRDTVLGLNPKMHVITATGDEGDEPKFPVLRNLPKNLSLVFQILININYPGTNGNRSLLGYLGLRRTQRNEYHSGIQTFSTLCLSTKWLAESNVSYWNDVLQRIGPNMCVNTPTLHTHLDPSEFQKLSKKWTCSLCHKASKSEFKKTQNENNETVHTHEKRQEIVIRDQPEITGHRRNNSIGGCNNDFTSNWTLGQSVRVLLEERCERCGETEENARQVHQLMFLATHNSFLCTHCMNATVALNESDYGLLALTNIKHLSLNNISKKGALHKNFSSPNIKLNTFFYANTIPNKTVLALCGNGIQKSAARSMTCIPSAPVVTELRERERKEERSLSQDQILTTSFRTDTTIQNMMRNSPHPTLGLKSVVRGWHIELNLVASNTKTDNLFLHVFHCCKQHSNTCYILSVVKLKPNKTLYQKLLKIKRKINLAIYDLDSDEEEGKQGIDQLRDDCLELLDEFVNMDVMVYIKPLNETALVCKGKCTNILFDQNRLQNEILFEVKYQLSKTGQRRELKNKFFSNFVSFYRADD
jgi:hypothetical protein